MGIPTKIIINSVKGRSLVGIEVPNAPRSVVAVDPDPALPKPPVAVASGESSWRHRLAQQLRFAFSRYGMAINSNALSVDRERMRNEFVSRYI